MRQKSRLIALSGITAALAMCVMLLGGILPLQTFVAPALAGFLLLPILYEFGQKWALACYVAIALLALTLSPDKESALLFAFLGYYPALKPRIDKIKAQPARVILKLALFNAAIGIMLVVAVRLFGLTAILDEYAEMSRAMLIAFIILANITLLLYDVSLTGMLRAYIYKLRPKLLAGH